MKAPGFWSNLPGQPGWQARALAPAAWVWQVVSRLRSVQARPFDPGVPVLCIGNLTAGGAGKTPMVAALMERLSQRGISPHVVSRGYGGRLDGPHLVDPTEDTVADVGDEPLMLAARGLVWVSRDRAAGVRAAAEAGAPLILLDDGFQNPGVVKHAAILMVDAGQGFGNGRIIPAGPLREAVGSGLARADLTVLVGDAPQRQAALDMWPEIASAPVACARIQALEMGLPLSGEDVVAFAGLGRPEKFFDTLRGMGARLTATHAFPDHHPYAPAIIRRLISDARQRGAMLVTTEKDAVRLPEALRGEVLTVQIELVLEDWAPVNGILDRLISERPYSRHTDDTKMDTT